MFGCTNVFTDKRPNGCTIVPVYKCTSITKVFLFLFLQKKKRNEREQKRFLILFLKKYINRMRNEMKRSVIRLKKILKLRYFWYFFFHRQKTLILLFIGTHTNFVSISFTLPANRAMSLPIFSFVIRA
jgi:hypothetical protein